MFYDRLLLFMVSTRCRNTCSN